MECTLDMNARERLELPIGMIKRYISTHYHYHDEVIKQGKGGEGEGVHVVFV